MCSVINSGSVASFRGSKLNLFIFIKKYMKL